MTPAVYAALAPYVTVHARLRAPHGPTAPQVVRDAMTGAGLARRGTGAEAPEEDEEMSDLQRRLAERAEEEAALGPTPQSLGGDTAVAYSRSRTFAIHAEARTPSGAVFARRAVVRLRGRRGVEVFAWQQGRRELFPLEAAGSEGSAEDGAGAP